MEKLLFTDKVQKAKQVKAKTATADIPTATRQLLDLQHRMGARLPGPASTPLCGRDAKFTGYTGALRFSGLTSASLGEPIASTGH